MIIPRSLRPRYNASKSKRAHAGEQCRVVRAVAVAARGDAALGVQLAQRLVEGEQRVRRRREAELAVLLEATPLTEQVQAQAAPAALRRQQRLAAGDDAREPRYALDALVRRRHQVVDLARLHVDRQRAEAAHRIDDVRTP